MWPSLSPTAAVRAWLLLGVGLGSLALAGCKQQEGERCELASDCASGLECVPVEKQDKQCKQPGGAPIVNPGTGGAGGGAGGTAGAGGAGGAAGAGMGGRDAATEAPPS